MSLYTGMARKIYEPVISGEMYQSGNYPTSYKSTQPENKNTSYDILGALINYPYFGGGLSGEQVQNMALARQMMQQTQEPITGQTIQQEAMPVTAYQQPVDQYAKGETTDWTGLSKFFGKLGEAGKDVYKYMGLGGQDFGAYSNMLNQVQEGGEMFPSYGAIDWGSMGYEPGLAGGLTGATGISNIAPALGILSMVGQQGVPLTNPVAQYLNYIPFVGSVLGTAWQGLSGLFGKGGWTSPVPKQGSYLYQDINKRSGDFLSELRGSGMNDYEIFDFAIKNGLVPMGANLGPNEIKMMGGGPNVPYSESAWTGNISAGGPYGISKVVSPSEFKSMSEMEAMAGFNTMYPDWMLTTGGEGQPPVNPYQGSEWLYDQGLTNAPPTAPYIENSQYSPYFTSGVINPELLSGYSAGMEVPAELWRGMYGGNLGYYPEGQQRPNFNYDPYMLSNWWKK
jgi:hypothetical protein